MKMARVLSIGDLPFHGVFRLCMCESSGFFCNDRVALTNLDKSDFHTFYLFITPHRLRTQVLHYPGTLFGLTYGLQLKAQPRPPGSLPNARSILCISADSAVADSNSGK